MAKSPQEATASYYSRISSRLGYRFVMKRSQHFGYYDKSHKTEPTAQTNYHNKFAKLLHLRAKMKVLDAGCGQGVVACYLAKRFGVKVVGITITPYEVKSAKRRAKNMGVEDKTMFLYADYANPPLLLRSFDRIYTTESLSHASDVKAVLQRLYKLLKPAGQVVFAEYEMSFEGMDSHTLKLAEYIKNSAGLHGVDQFGIGVFEKTLKEVGFKEVRVHDWTQGVKPSFDRLRRLAKPMAQVIEKHPKLYRKFINILAARLYADGVDVGKFKYKVYTAKK